MVGAYYLVKHGASDFRLHTSDGTETGDSWAERPTGQTVRNAMDADGSTFGLIVAGGQVPDGASLPNGDNHDQPFVYRDLTISEESVPWQ